MTRASSESWHFSGKSLLHSPRTSGICLRSSSIRRPSRSAMPSFTGRFLEIPSRRRLIWTMTAAAVLIMLFVVPWRLRVAGPARVLPGRRAAVTAGVDGTVMTVLRHEGDTVKAGDVIATLDPESYRAAAEDARAAYRIAESEVTRFREAGDSPNMFEAASRRDEARAKLDLEEDRLNRTTLRAPTSGIIVTPRIEERVGQLLTRGSEMCVIADSGSVV